MKKQNHRDREEINGLPGAGGSAGGGREVAVVIKHAGEILVMELFCILTVVVVT